MLLNILKLLLLLLATLPQHSFSHEKNHKPNNEIFSNNCNFQSFESFFAHFASSESAQKEFIKIPFKIQYIQSKSAIEPEAISKRLYANEIKFPVFPMLKERTERKLSINTISKSENMKQVILFKDGTDYVVHYNFVKRNCWILESMEDWSL